MTKIKICGITSEEEASWLAGEGVSYAGFVFYEKSKRRVAIDDAARIAKSLGGGIKKVAVAVSPDAEMVGRIEEAGFDILQVHGPFDWDAMRGRKIPVWRAANISGMDGLSGAIGELPPCVCGVLLDAGDFGSGKTFGWDASGGAESASAGSRAALQGAADSAKGGEDAAKGGAASSFWPAYHALRERLRERGASLILAGGLSCENVAEAIRLFSPDAVDVSSGVERRVAMPQGGIPQGGIGAAPGKDRELIRLFCSEVKNAVLAADRSAEKPM